MAGLVSAVGFENRAGFGGDVANDVAGNTYVSSKDYVAKYSPSGQELWGYGVQGAVALSVGNSGSLYFAGSLYDNLTVDGHTIQFDWNRNGGWYVGKIGADSHVEWLTDYQRLASNYWEPSAIAVDEANNKVYVGGTTLNSNGWSVATVLALDMRDSNNVTVAWQAKAEATTSLDVWGNDLAIDSAGSVYLAGHFRGKVDFDPGSGTNYVTSGTGSPPNYAGYVWKLTPTGSLGWVKAFPSSKSSGSYSLANSIAIDTRNLADATDDRVIVAGHFAGKIDFDPGKPTLNLSTYGGSDLFLLGFSVNGDLARNSNGSYALARSYGTSGIEDFPAITLDAQGAIYVAAREQTGSSKSLVVTKFNSAGSLLPWSVRLKAADLETNNFVVSVDPLTGRVNVIGDSRGDVDADGDGVIDIYDHDANTWDRFWCTYQ